MRRILSVLALCIALTLVVSSHAQPASQAKAGKMGKQQLLSLIATAKTPAEHRRIAEYYEAEAKSYLAQAKEHEDLAAAYKKNPITSSSKYATGTLNHCDYFAHSFKDDAAKMQELAEMHEQMAKDAEHK